MTISKNVFMVLDTETCDLSGSVYDVGYTICDKHGTIYKTYNSLVREIFTDAQKMMGAFYAKKTRLERRSETSRNTQTEKSAKSGCRGLTLSGPLPIDRAQRQGGSAIP